MTLSKDVDREGYPRVQYSEESGINIGSRGRGNKELNSRSAVSDEDLKGSNYVTSRYSQTQITETPGGHTIELNDTLGSERIMIRHSSGTGIEIRPDGSIFISANSIVYDVSGNANFNMHGNTNFKIDGRLKFDVGGDLDFDIGGNTRLKTGGTYSENITGSRYSYVDGDSRIKVAGESTLVTVGNRVETNLSGYQSNTKGELKMLADGNGGIYVSGSLGITSQIGTTISSQNLSLTGSQLQVVGASGTIGGEGISHYGQNYFGTSATFDEGVSAPTFHGSLQGNAATATEAGSAGTAGSLGGGGSAGAHTVTATNTVQTAKPSSANVALRLKTKANGIRLVSIDPGSYIKNSIDRSANNGMQTE